MLVMASRHQLVAESTGFQTRGRHRIRRTRTVVKPVLMIATLMFSTSCASRIEPAATYSSTERPINDLAQNRPYVVVLGTAQDGGYPQAGCRRACCMDAWQDPSRRSGAVCIAVVDPASRQRWLFDATPDFRKQLRLLDEDAPPTSVPGLDGVFLTHAHIGHYAGLVYLGREVLGANGVPVFAMPRMRAFLSTNGPWDQLVRLGNIELRPLTADAPVPLNARISVTPLVVPHRDEYSETVGFRISGPTRAVLYVPDIDKWDRWERAIEDLIAAADVAYLDGTFFAEGEIPNRSMADIPHPFIVESMTRFEEIPEAERSKIRFVHLNHTNPALHAESAARRQIEATGFRVATVGERVGL